MMPVTPPGSETFRAFIQNLTNWGSSFKKRCQAVSRCIIPEQEIFNILIRNKFEVYIK